VNPKRLLARLAAGHMRNVSFRDFSALVEEFGFRQARIDGSHHIYQHENVVEQLNL
jgi:predicted RNA binding protein YcfA (HicA-like mRNA interferase family)